MSVLGVISEDLSEWLQLAQFAAIVAGGFTVAWKGGGALQSLRSHDEALQEKDDQLRETVDTLSDTVGALASTVATLRTSVEVLRTMVYERTGPPSE